MTDHDRIFKELLGVFFAELIGLFLPEVAAYIDPGSITLVDKEVFTDVVSGDKHEVDLVASAKFRDQDSFFLVHVEAQASREPRFGARMFRYFARLHEARGLPVYPIVVFTFDRPRTVQPNEYRVTFPDCEPLVFRYRVIQLNRLAWRDYLGQTNPLAAALMAKMEIAPGDRPRVKLECLRLLATLKLDPARTKLISGFVDTYLRLSAEEMTQYKNEMAELAEPEREEVMEIVTSWMEEGIQQGLAQGLQKGLAQGREEGREEGLEQGLRQGQATILRRMLERRFGPLPEWAELKLMEAEPAVLEEWGIRMLEAGQLEEVLG